MTKKNGSNESQQNFQDMMPRSIYAESSPDNHLIKTSSDLSGMGGYGGGSGGNGMYGGGSGGAGDILRNPARRFYHPEYTMSAMYMPRERTQVNRWCRWYYDHDEMIGSVLDMHSELPYSQFEIEEEDPYIKRQFEDCIDHTNLFSKLSPIDLEFLKIGEVFIYTPWNAKKGMWDTILVQNPDFIETRYSPFADHESVIELKPDPELRSLIHSTKPEEQALKRKLPNEILRRVLAGKNIILPNDEVTHIARRSNPYDMRGTSIIRRIFRCYVPETKVRMFDGTCKEIKDVVKGDFVLSLHGEKREVIDTVQYKIDDKIVEIKPEKSWESLKSTLGHEYLVQKSFCACGCDTELTYRQLKNGSNFIHGHNLKFNSNRIEGGPSVVITEPLFKIEKLPAEKIKKGDRLLVPINNEIGECNLTEGQGRFLGYYMAEGCISNEFKKQPAVIFTFGKHEIDTWVADVVNILEEDFDIFPYIYPGRHGKNVCEVRISRKADFKKLYDFLNNNLLGRRSWTKEFTENVLYYPKNIQKQILIGAFRGDASRNKNYSETYYTTTSKKLAEQVQWLLFRCGYYNYIKPWDPKPKRILSNTYVSILKRYYWVRITGQDSRDFIKDCWDDYKELFVKNTEIYDVIKDMKDVGYTYTRIAKELNTMGLKGVEGGSFYNNIVKGIFINEGSVHKSYQFTRDKIIKDENYFYVPVKETSIKDYKGTVHDITVDTNHWWLAGGTTISSNTLMYEDKLREAQITISDAFIYPLKIFKLGDPNKGWIPNSQHQHALAAMLQQAAFDPNFALIYHYALNVEYVTVADKVMRLDPEWSEINKRKAYALGVSEDFLSGSSTYSCFVEGTKLLTPNGIIPIEKVKKGDLIFDKEGDSQKVLDNWDEGIPKELIKIKLWGKKEFICTPNHKWPVWSWPRECACGCGKLIRTGKAYAHSIGKPKNRIVLEDVKCNRTTINNKKIMGTPPGYNFYNTIEASKIKKWDYLMIPRKFKEVKTNATRDLALLTGYFIAEGNYSKHAKTKEITGINLTFSIHERDTFVKESKMLCEKYGIPIREIEERSSSLRLRSVDRMEFKDKVMWFKENVGEYSGGKKLSEEIMGWPLFLKKELVKGMFRGDGHKKLRKFKEGSLKNKYPQFYVCYTTVSEVLAMQLELILAQLGYAVSWTIQQHKGNRQVVYRLNIYGEFAVSLAKLIWDDCTDDFFKDYHTEFKGQKDWIDDNYVYKMIRSVEVIKNIKQQKVYNLTVEKTHSYLVENMGTYNSANVGLQVQLARYKAKRDIFEQQWLRDKFFRVMSEKNQWYIRDKKELVGQYRVTRNEKEKQDRLVVPNIVWQKKLMFRDDQSYLTFLNQVYQNGKGPISAITLLQSMGLDIEDELKKKGRTARLEKVHGVNVHPPVGGVGGMGGITAKEVTPTKKGFWNSLGKKANGEEIEPKLIVSDEDLEKAQGAPLENANIESVIVLDIEEQMFEPVDDAAWYSNLESPNIPVEVLVSLTGYKAKLDTIPKKYPGNIAEGYKIEKEALTKFLVDLYMQGKITAYSWTDFLPVYKEVYAIDNQLRDFSDIAMANEMSSWFARVANGTRTSEQKGKILRNMGNVAFAHGQLKGFQEQGIYNVKLSNVKSNDGLRYRMNELLSKGDKIASDVSPKDEIIIFAPCIEGFDGELENTLDPYIKRHRDFFCKGITVKACPVEYIPFMKRYIEKIGGFLKNYNIITFVEDVIDVPEWETALKTKLEKSYGDENKELRNTLVARDIMVEKIHKKAKVTHFAKGKNLYISSWIGMEDRSIIDSLVDYIDIFDNNTVSNVRKAFKTANYDLTEEEVQTYGVFNYIEPLSGDMSNPRGYKVSSVDDIKIPDKVRKGKVWDTAGKCLYSANIDSIDIFRDNLKLWIEYPQLLDNEIRSAFKSL